MDKFKQGDLVRVRHLLAKNQISRITRVEENGYWVSNTFWVGNIFCTERNLEPIDPTTAFLTELQNLLRKYDACINISWNNYFDADKSPCIDMDIEFGNNNSHNGICYHDILSKTLTPDKIFDDDML